MKSHIADMKNSGGRFAGTITAGMFLKQYVATDKVGLSHEFIVSNSFQQKLLDSEGGNRIDVSPKP